MNRVITRLLDTRQGRPAPGKLGPPFTRPVPLAPVRNGGPALNALGTIMLVMSFVVAIIGYLGYRWLTRGERGSRIDALTTIAGSEG